MKPTTEIPMFGRQDELRAVFSRLSACQSVAVIGEPHTGKSLLLAQVANPIIRRKWSLDPNQFVIVNFDGRLLPPHFTVNRFWEQVFDTLGTFPRIKDEVDQILSSNVSTSSVYNIERFFRQLGRREMRAVILIDHIGHFLSHVESVGDILGSLRSLSSRTGGLVLLVASRQRIRELNQITVSSNAKGSPFFNTLQEIRLGILREDEAQQVLASRFDFNTDAILKVTGYHPYLISLLIRMHKIPPSINELLDQLTYPAFKHYDLASQHLQGLFDVLIEAVSIKKRNFDLVPGDIQELIWRGWLQQAPDHRLKPASLLLERWLENRGYLFA